MEWVHAESAPGETWRWLEAMATNEATLDAAEAIGELTRVLERHPPGPIGEHAALLRDLIWEAGEPTNDWLTWRPCRLCSRRWAVRLFEGVPLCPGHRDTASLMRYLQDEMARYPGLVDHAARLAALAERLAGEPAALAPAAATNGAGPAEAPVVAGEALLATPPVVAAEYDDEVPATVPLTPG
jgi:hypothetical protein